MAEIPEHLLKRAAERKAALEAKKQAESGGAPTDPAAAAPAAGAGGEGTGPSAEEVAASNAEAEKSGKIPAHLLARSQAARAKAEGGDGGGGGTTTATAPAPGASAPAAAAARVTGAAPGGAVAGPAGHTQRLLTV